jgi:hypothetical protein
VTNRRRFDQPESRPPTPRTSLAAGVLVFAICKRCNHDARLDLAALIAAGLEHMPLRELPLRCTRCGEQGHSIIVAGRGVREASFQK